MGLAVDNYLDEFTSLILSNCVLRGNKSFYAAKGDHALQKFLEEFF
jgi:hypothetical protein